MQETANVSLRPPADVVARLGALLFKDAALERNDYGMSAVARFKFRQNALNVSFDGMHGQLQVVGDDLVGLSQRHCPQDIQVAYGQGVFSCVFGHRCSDLRGYPSLACMDEPNGIREIGAHHALQQVAARSGLERLKRKHVPAKGSEYDDSSC